MSIHREAHDEPWKVDELVLTIRSLFDTLRKYADYVESQNDVELSADTIHGIGKAGYDLADRAYDEVLRADKEEVKYG